MPPTRSTTYTIRLRPFMATDPTPTPVPTPAPVPVPVARPWYVEILTPAAIVFFALVALYVARTPAPAPPPVTPPPVTPPNADPWTPVPNPNPQPPQPPPPPAGPLATAARDYVRGLAGTFTDMARGIRSGQIRDKAAAVELTKARRQAFTDALDRAFTDNCDANGSITSPGPLADALDQAARATGGN